MDFPQDPFVWPGNYPAALPRMGFFFAAFGSSPHTHASNAVRNWAVVVYFYLRAMPAVIGG